MGVGEVGRADPATAVSGSVGALLEALAAAVVLVDAAGRVVGWSAGARGLFDLEAEHAVGRPLAELVPALAPERGAGTWVRDVSLVGADGRLRALRVTATPLPVDEGVGALTVLACEDRTEAVELERRLAAVGEAARVDARHAEFLAMLGHELRNPLMPVLAAAHAIRVAAGPNPAIQRAARVIERQARHLGRLVDDLLDVSRIRHGKIELRLERVDLAEAVQDALAGVEHLVRAGHYDVSVALADEPVVVRGDRARLVQVVANLLHNALKYTSPGGQILVTVAREGHEAVVRVRDTGLGIEPELLPRIFDLFAQGARPGGARGGLGLGLALVRQIVLLHGGRVSAASAGLGHGSEFEVRLPVAAAAAQPPARAAAPSVARPRPARVLLVEDNTDARDMLQTALELEGHFVYAAGVGTDGVLLGRETAPDAAVIDLGLPGMDGYEVARALREALGPGPFLVALSGFGGEEVARRARQAGFDAHLTKPVDPAELLALLGSRVGGRGVA